MGDSLDLGRLADNLPNSNGRGARAMQAAEADLQSAFRNSALCITQMLKAGQKASKRSYQAGYSTALQDVLEYLQASLDVNVAQQRSNEGIAQVIDYIEARQEAVRVELQDLEADEDQQQQQQQSSSQQQQQHASPQVHPSTSSSSQYFRSHPHRQQHHQQEQQSQASSISYRQVSQQQQQYQPVASTSSGSVYGLSNITNQNQSHQGHQRKQRRSLSPLVSRTSNTASTMQALPTHARLPGSSSLSSALNSSNLPYQHRQVNDIEAERTQESIPLASSSSIPNSPEARFLPERGSVVDDHHHHHLGEATALSSPLASGVAPARTNNTDASLSNASNVVSPLTRLQAKRERERPHHDRRGRNSHGHGRDLEQNALAAQGSANATVAAGVKRRWTAALLPEHHTINLSMNLSNDDDQDGNGQNTMEGEDDDEEDDEDLASNEEATADQTQTRKDHGSALTTTTMGDDDEHNDSEMMEMDDSSYRIDGNARPNKRTARR